MDMNEVKPEVTKAGLLSMQVCVPADWTDEQVKAFADTENEAGTTNGWFVRKQGAEALAGCDERVKCESREGAVHIMLDC
jgi:hypothetical protein